MEESKKLKNLRKIIILKIFITYFSFSLININQFHKHSLIHKPKKDELLIFYKYSIKFYQHPPMADNQVLLLN